MGHKFDCKKAQNDIFSVEENPDIELLAHLEACPDCKEQYQKAKALRSLVKKSAPEVPNLRDAVVGTIEKEKISPEKAKPVRKRLPVGTLAAAAAVLVIYFSAKGTVLPDVINQAVNEEDFGYVTSDSAHEVAESETYVETTSAGAGGSGAKLYASKSKSSSEYFFDGKADGTQNAALAAIPETCVEEEQTDAVYDRNSLADGTEMRTYDNDMITGAVVETETEDTAEIAPENYGDMLFIKLSEAFPDRISEEIYKKVGAEIFISFVDGISDFETEYTEQALLGFAEKNAK